MFDFMKLPPELRITIYEYALVRDVIRIVSTVHPIGALSPLYFNSAENFYEDHNPKGSMRLRSTREEYENVKYVSGEKVADQILWSYGIQPTNSPLVNIFLLNRQVYSEAWPIFYEQNAFSFAMPGNTVKSAENCLRFLYDRPHHALRHIREMHLIIGNTPQHPIHLNLYCGAWQHLLEEINRYLSIRVLHLYIRGRTDDASTRIMPDLPWRDWLYKMNGLRKLEIDIAGESTHEENIALVKQMRTKMVLGGEQMGVEGITLGVRPLKYIAWTEYEPPNRLTTSPEILDLEDNY